MKKLIKAALTAAVMCVAAVTMSLCVSAETEDVELSVTRAKATSGAWGQSVIFDKGGFDCGRINEDTVIEVEFELDGEWSGTGSPIELILQNYSTASPEIWAKVEPYDTDFETYAYFGYDEMVKMYGSDDFSTVDNMCIGDCGIVMTVTKVTVKNCEKVEVTTTTVSETTPAATESVTEAAPAETEAAATASSENESGGIPIVLIVVITVVVAVAIVVVIIIMKNRKRFY